MKAAWGLSICALVFSNPAAAQAGDAALRTRLATIAQAYARDDDLMASVLVARGDEVLLGSGYGKADLEWGIDNGPGVEFRIGSITKQFTAALVLLLQQDGKLSLSDSVTKVLPEAPKAWSGITLAQLLGQTSGIPDFTDDKAFHVWSMSERTPAEELAFIDGKPLEFAPGSRFEYSNSNYIVLGLVIEKVTGKTYGQVLRERILTPLRMTETGLDEDDLVLPHRAEGYQKHGDRLVVARSESMSVPYAAGSIYSSTRDLLRWERALFGGQLLLPQSLSAMTTAGLGDYGLGVLAVKRDGQKVIWHNGGIEGFHAFLAYVPDKAVTVAVLSNVDNGIPDVLGAQLLDTALGEPVVLAAELKPVPISPEALDRLIGDYPLSPAITLTFSLDGAALALSVRDHKRDLTYQGLKDGRPTFVDAKGHLEISFVVGPDGRARAAVLDQGLQEQTVDRKAD